MTAGSIDDRLLRLKFLTPSMHIATLGEGAKAVHGNYPEEGPAAMSPLSGTSSWSWPRPPLAPFRWTASTRPVLKVNYTVENTRVEQITDYDKLTLEVWTDGTISAKEAVSLAAKILNETSQPTLLIFPTRLTRTEIMVEERGYRKRKGP